MIHIMKKGNAVVLILIVVLSLFLFLVLSKETRKTSFEKDDAEKVVVESDITLRKAILKGIRESMADGLNGLENNTGDTWFCNKVLPPDIEEAGLKLNSEINTSVADFLDTRRMQGYYENISNISIEIDHDPSEWQDLDDDYLSSYSLEFLSGIESPEITTIKNNTEDYMVKTRIWYLYKNIIQWMQDTEAGNIIGLLDNVFMGLKDCMAVNSACDCPGTGDTIVPNGVVDSMHVTWEDVAGDMIGVEDSIEQNINEYFSTRGINITCKAEMMIDHSKSYVTNFDQFDYRKGPTNIGTDSDTWYDGDPIVMAGLCPCEAGTPPPVCRNNFLSSPDLWTPASYNDMTQCEDAVAPLDGLYARFEYVGVDRVVRTEIRMTCYDNSAVMDGDRNFEPNTMVFNIRSAVMDQCDPPLGAINSEDSVCWEMTAENVGPNCEFLMSGAQPPVDPATPTQPDGLGCAMCTDAITDIDGNVIGCNSWVTFPTDNPDFFDNDDCQAVLTVCQNQAPFS